MPIGLNTFMRLSLLMLVLVSVATFGCWTLPETPQAGLASIRGEKDIAGEDPNTSGAEIGALDAGADVDNRRSRVNLAMAVLARGQLHQADLSRANLRGVVFSEARGFMARFKEADLAQAVLRNADFSGADFDAACLDGEDLEGARLAEAFMEGACLRNANVTGADFSNAYLGEAELAGLRGWSTATWSGANILNVKNAPEGFSALVKSQGGGAWMIEENLPRETGQEKALSEGREPTTPPETTHVVHHLSNAPEPIVRNEKPANFARAVFPRGQINGADLSGAYLRHFLLLEGRAHKTRFKGADLTRAWLDKSNFTGADFSDACLDSATADMAVFASTRFVNASMIAFRSEHGSIWANAVLDGADLEGARLNGGFMHGASLRNANVEGADFTDAYLGEADLEGLRGWEKATWRAAYLVDVRNAPDGLRALATKQNLR